MLDLRLLYQCDEYYLWECDTVQSDSDHICTYLFTEGSS
jgi:hypothetical protein